MARDAWRILAVAAFMGPLAVSSALAQTPLQIDWCLGQAGATSDQIIDGCTAVIQLGYTGQFLVTAFNNRGIGYAQKGQYDRAIADYDQAIQLNPNYAAAFNNRGNGYSQKREYERAIADYDQAIRLNPYLAEAFAGRGNVYVKKGGYDRAIADLDEAVRLNPNLAEAFANRGWAFGHKDEYDRAIADYDQAIQLNPNYATAFTNRGRAYTNKGEYDLAISDYDQAIRLNPNYTEAFFNRGAANFDKGDFAAAAADLLRANDIMDDAYGMLWRFLARGRIGQNGEAELSTNAARLKTKDWPYPVIEFYLGRRPLNELLAAPSNAEERCETTFYLGQWQLLRGNKAEAREALQNAADTCPKGFDEYAGAVAEMKRLNQ